MVEVDGSNTRFIKTKRECYNKPKGTWKVYQRYFDIYHKECKHVPCRSDIYRALRKELRTGSQQHWQNLCTGEERKHLVDETEVEITVLNLQRAVGHDLLSPAAASCVCWCHPPAQAAVCLLTFSLYMHKKRCVSANNWAIKHESTGLNGGMKLMRSLFLGEESEVEISSMIIVILQWCLQISHFCF